MIRDFGNNKSVLVVNLNNLKENYKITKSLLNDNTECSAVVKANAYGLGFIEVSKTLSEIGCKNFFVANFSEGLELRRHLKEVKIYILNGLNIAEFEDCYSHNITPVLNDIKDIESYNKFAKSKNLKLPCAIHTDTGMGRLGLSSRCFEKFVKDDALRSYLKIEYLMSHLACSDEPASEMNFIQLNKFKMFAKSFPDIKLSFANSSGICLGREYHFNLVRPGCMLYGLNPTPYILPSPVKTVAKIYGKVLQIRTLCEDQTISYGGTYTGKKGDRIATIACGYADGYHRIMSNNTFCYFKGYKLPVIGIITMDMIMVDINTLPESLLNRMNYVELLGDNVKLEELAPNAKTIGYEILTSLSNRFNRVYDSTNEEII